MLKNFKSIKRDIENNIYCNEMIMFDEHDRDNNNIKSVYKSFQNIRLQSEKEM